MAVSYSWITLSLRAVAKRSIGRGMRLRHKARDEALCAGATAGDSVTQLQVQHLHCFAPC